MLGKKSQYSHLIFLHILWYTLRSNLMQWFYRFCSKLLQTEYIRSNRIHYFLHVRSLLPILPGWNRGSGNLRLFMPVVKFQFTVANSFRLSSEQRSHLQASCVPRSTPFISIFSRSSGKWNSYTTSLWPSFLPSASWKRFTDLTEATWDGPILTKAFFNFNHIFKLGYIQVPDWGHGFIWGNHYSATRQGSTFSFLWITMWHFLF